MDKRDILDQKILDSVRLQRLIAYWNFKGQSISLAYGTFDVLKAGSIDMIIEAANKGDVLLVAVKADDLVAKHKGEGNPINHHCNRALALASLQLISAVVIVNAEDPSELIDMVKPSFVAYCKYAVEAEINTFRRVHDWGGEIVQFDTEIPIKYHKDSGCCN
jgi:bifunctional ADP-heptose synthase (sugar kinase/adenylyltransferase)